MVFKSILLITGKDLALRVRDRSVFILAFATPLLLSFIFGIVFGEIDQFEPHMLIVDQDQDEISLAMRVNLSELEKDGVVSLEYSPNRRTAVSRIEEGATGALLIPDLFTQNIRNNIPTQVEVLGNIDQETGVAVIEAITAGFVAEVEAVQLSVSAALADLTSPPTDQVTQTLGEAAASLEAPIAIADTEAVVRELDTRTYYAAGMAVFFVFFAVQFGASGMVEERFLGTLSRLLVAPIRRGTVIMGKLLVSYLVGFASMLVLALSTSIFLGASWGDPLWVGVLILTAVMAAGGITILVSSFAKTPQQAGNLSSVVSVGFGLLSGVFFPAGLGEGFLSDLATITPHRWFLVALGDLSGGGGWSIIWPSVVVLVGYALVTTIPAWWLMNRIKP